MLIAEILLPLQLNANAKIKLKIHFDTKISKTEYLSYSIFTPLEIKCYLGSVCRSPSDCGVRFLD